MSAPTAETPPTGPAAHVPEWQGYDTLPSMQADRASDPDYIAARLGELLDHAAEATADWRGDEDHRHLADAVELRLIRDWVQRLCGDLRLFGRDGDAMYTRLTAQFPRMHWYRFTFPEPRIVGGPSLTFRDGYRTIVPDNAAAAECADHLGLTAQDGQKVPTWRGVVDGWHVTVAEWADPRQRGAAAE